MIICKKKQTPRSKVKTCGGHVKIICNKNLKTDPLRYPIALKCSKCDVRPFKFHEDTLNPYERMTNAGTSTPNQTTFSRDNLRHILATLTTGMGYPGYCKYMAALGLDFISERSYYDHCNHIYQIQKQVFKEYQDKVIKLLHIMYKEKAEKDGEDLQLIDNCLPIMVAGDGSYPRRGKISLECIYFIVDVLTAMPVDVHVVRRCNKCPNRKKKTLNVSTVDCSMVSQLTWNRKPQKFYLQGRKTCDGDASTHSKVKDTYGPNCPVKKGECIAHYFKRLSNHYQVGLFEYDCTHLTSEGEKRKNMLIQYNEDKKKDPTIKAPKELLQMNKMLYKKEYPLRDKRKNIAQRMSAITMINMHKNRHKGPIAMSEGVKSVPRHHADYSGTSEDRRAELHQYCDNTWCDYQKMPENQRSSYQPGRQGILGICKRTTEKKNKKKLTFLPATHRRSYLKK